MIEKTYTTVQAIAGKLVASENQTVYFIEDYRRKGRITIACDPSKPGRVKVQWLLPKERLSWVRVTYLRDQETSKKLYIDYK